MRTLFLILMLSVGYVGGAVAQAPAIPGDKDVIKFESKLGLVTFQHKKHADLKIAECKTCHHTFKAEAGEAVKPCHECHKKKGPGAKGGETKVAAAPGEKVPPPAKDIFHKRCTACHEYTAQQGQQAGPIKKKCKLCHIKQK